MYRSLNSDGIAGCDAWSPPAGGQRRNWSLCSQCPLQCVAIDRVSNHHVAGSTTESTVELIGEAEVSQLVDCCANVALVRDGSVVLPKQMRYQTAPRPVPVPRDPAARRHRN